MQQRPFLYGQYPVNTLIVRYGPIGTKRGVYDAGQAKWL